MIKTVARNIFRKLGFEISRIERLNKKKEDDSIDHVSFEQDAKKAIKIIEDYTMLPTARLVSLFQQVVHCERYGLPGSYVECGVWKGGAVGLMALANKQYGKDARTLHLFDAFNDICEPDPDIDGTRALEDVKMFGKREPESITGKLESIDGFYDEFGGAGTIDECKSLFEKIIEYDSNKVHYHKGWFQDTLPDKSGSIDQIAILRLDGDWYASTKICLKYLYDKVVQGGFIVFDDYGYYEGCTKAIDEFIAERNINSYLHQVDFGCKYLVKS